MTGVLFKVALICVKCEKREEREAPSRYDGDSGLIGIYPTDLPATWRVRHTFVASKLYCSKECEEAK